MPIPALLGWLASAGLGLVRDAVIAKGEQFVEEKLGVKLPTKPSEMTPEKAAELTQLQYKHEEFLVSAALEEKKIELEADKHGQTQVTERWKADMSSDSWLSKNVRPLTLIAVTINITGMIIADGAGVKFSLGLFSLIELVVGIVYGAYFLGRSLEKGTSVVTKMKEKLGVTKR